MFLLWRMVAIAVQMRLLTLDVFAAVCRVGFLGLGPLLSLELKSYFSWYYVFVFSSRVNSGCRGFTPTLTNVRNRCTVAGDHPIGGPTKTAKFPCC